MARTPQDATPAYPADERDLDSYRSAQTAMARMQVPVLSNGDSNERLYVAGFDGTGNEMSADPAEHHTAVAKIVQQVQRADRANLGAGYVEGPGTQDEWFIRVRDLAKGVTVEERVERMYKLFIEQSAAWLEANAEAKIRIAAIGFSRGAEEAALFTRVVDERGIQDRKGAVYTRDDDGNITNVSYARPPLVPPGQTAQAVVLLDPVATGRLEELDRRLPPSVISGLQISAEDERRDQFPATNHLEPGYSEGRRFLNVTVGGAHSNIGDWYARNGLGIRSTNLVVDYLNALSDKPFLTKRAEPDDPWLNVVHRSDHSRIPYPTFRMLDGVRNRRQDVANPELCESGAIRDCWNKEPMDRALDRQFEHRAVPIMAAPPLPPELSVHLSPLKRSEGSTYEGLFDDLSRAAYARDAAGMRSVGREFLASPAGQDWLQEGREHNRRAAEVEPAVPQLQAQEPPQQRIRAMHH